MQTSIRWHSRAGQGAITAANFLAEACAKLNFFTQSFPAFGAEKRGAPVIVFNRISKIKNNDPAFIQNPDIVILLDQTLVGEELSQAEILNGLPNDGKFIINTDGKKIDEFSKKFSGKIIIIDATKIALETIGRNIPNVAMVGCITKILGIDKILVKKFLTQTLQKTFGEKLVEKNLLGFERGYLESFVK